MKASSESLVEHLRDGVREGAPVRRLLDSWPAVEVALARDGEALAEVLAAAAELDAGAACAAVTAGEAVTLAVVDLQDRPLYADAAFRAWFPAPGEAPGLRAMVRRARSKGPVTGLLETADGVMVTAWAGAAGGWPLPAPARQALARPGAVAVVVFAPSRSSALAARAAEAFDLTPLEARLADALLFAPTLEVAAGRIGVGRETARDAQRRVMAKMGVRRASEIVRRLVELMCASGPGGPVDEAVIAETLGLSRPEARVAVRIAEGSTYAEAGRELGLTEETVRTYAKSALSKAGVRRGKDLARLAAEIRGLDRLAGVAEPVFLDSRLPGRLRVTPSASGERRIAFVDYGPATGRPLLVFHGYTQGRTLPTPFVEQLQARGLRPIVPQRPGYGLTDPAAEDHLATAVDDLAALAARLKLSPVRILARDGGAAIALAFADRRPALFAGGVLLNPRAPARYARPHAGAISSVSRILLRHPRLIGTFAEILRRQCRTDLVELGVRRSLTSAADRAALDDPALLDQLVRDIQALSALSSAGFAAEHMLYAGDWSPPRAPAGPWTVVTSGGLGPPGPPTEPWAHLPDVRFHVIPGAGLLAQYTHAEALAALVVGAGDLPASAARVA